jgi:hypothetical protein
MKQVQSSKGLSKEAKSKGGQVTKTDRIVRQVHVEKLMKMGYSLTRISAAKLNGKKLGNEETIKKDMNIIRSRWLDQDPDWFHRARLARIESKERLLEQMIRLGDLILEIQHGKYDYNSKGEPTEGERPRKLVQTESQLTLVISKIYEIDADFDPEQYLDKRIAEAMEDKIKEGKTETS